MITLNTTATSADVRGVGATMCAPIALAGDVRPAGTSAVVGTRLPRTAAFLGNRRERATAERFLAPAYLPQHDGTTLGIHSPGRPQS